MGKIAIPVAVAASVAADELEAAIVVVAAVAVRTGSGRRFQSGRLDRLRRCRLGRRTPGLYERNQPRTNIVLYLRKKRDNLPS